MEEEFCASGDLSHCLWPNKSSNYYEKVIKNVATQLLLGLQELHSRGIIHCNLKPSNILINEFGNVKICDFKKALNVNTMTMENIRANKAAMTPCYTAPELFCENGAFSFKTDLWALGCIMYEMAIGQVPFFDESVNRLIQKIINEEVNFNKKVLKLYSEEFLDVIKKLLDKDPNNRPSWGDIEKMPFWDFEADDLNSTKCNSIETKEHIRRPHSSISYTAVNNYNRENSNNLYQKVHESSRSNSLHTNKYKNNSMSDNNHNSKYNKNNIEVYNNDEEEYSSSHTKDNINEMEGTDKEFSIKNNATHSETENYDSSSKRLFINNKLEFSVVNASKIIKSDKRNAKQNIEEVSMSISDPSDIPQINSIMIQGSDRIVNPIIGNKKIEPNPTKVTYSQKLLPFKKALTLDEIKDIIINDQSDELEKYLSMLYQHLDNYNSKQNYEGLLNLLNYFETIITSKEVANNVINTSFVKLFILFLDIHNDNIRIRSCSIIGTLIRYATSMEQPLDKYNLTEKLISFISDTNLLLNKKAIATLGEYLFFAATQVEGESSNEINLNENELDVEGWNVSHEAIDALLFALNHENDTVKFCALKTIENISILTSIAKNYFTSNDNFILKLIDIVQDNTLDNTELKSSAYSSISHLIKLEPTLFKLFLDKMIDVYTLLTNETPKNQQYLINCFLFAFAEDFNNIKYIKSDLAYPTFIKLLESSSSIIKSKIILILSLSFTDISTIIKFGPKILTLIQKLRMEKQQYYYYVKIFESFMISFCKKSAKYLFLYLNNSGGQIKEDTLNLLNMLSIMSPYQKISYVLFEPEFIESIKNIIYKSNNQIAIQSCLEILRNFSENSYCVEKQCEYIIKKLFEDILKMISILSDDNKREPLNICANILTVILDDDKLYSSVVVDNGKTSEINLMIIKILPVVSEYLNNTSILMDTLAFLCVIIERNSAFISFYKSSKIIDKIFILMMDPNYFSNLNLIKIMVKLVDSNDTTYNDIIEMGLIDKINYLLKKDIIEEINIYTEYVIEMLYYLMFKLNDYKKKKYNNNFDKEDYKKNFLMKISNISTNFNLCIKLLKCENEKIQEESCVCLIFILQFFPVGISDEYKVHFTTENIPDLLKGLDSPCTKIHKKIIKIFKWILEYQRDAFTVLSPYVSFLQIYIEKIRDTSKEQDAVDLSMYIIYITL